MAEKGHEDALLGPRLNARCRFSQGTFAGTWGNGRDAPKAVIPLAIVCGVEATQTRIATYLKGQRWNR